MPPKIISPADWLDWFGLRREGWRTKVVPVTAQAQAKDWRLDHLLRNHEVQDAGVVDGVGVRVTQSQNPREGVVAVAGHGKLNLRKLKHWFRQSCALY